MLDGILSYLGFIWEQLWWQKAAFLGTSLVSLVVKNLPSKAGGSGLTPGWGAKIPHASGQTYALQEKPENCNKRSPQAPQLEKAHPLQRRPSAAPPKKLYMH